MVINNPDDEGNAREFLTSLINLARLPETMIEVFIGNFKEIVGTAPRADLNIFGMDENFRHGFVNEMTEKTKSSCLFVKDSGHESILA